MYKTIKRIIAWSGRRKNRLYTGFLYSFFYTMFTALPIMAAAYGLSLILEDRNGTARLTSAHIFSLTGFILFAVAGRFWLAYLRAAAQESVGYGKAAEERLAIGAALKRVSLSFFNKKSAGEIAAAITTDLSFLERFGMKMIDTVVNGYISALTLVLCLSFYNIWISMIAAAGILLSALFLSLLSNKSRENAPVRQQAQDNMVAATFEYIRGMPVVKAFHQSGVSKEGIARAYRLNKSISQKIEKNFVPYNCLHLLALRLASTAMVPAAALFTLNGTMELPVMLMTAIFSFIIFGNIESVNNAAHILRIIDTILDKLDGIKAAAYIDQDGRDIEPSAYDIRFQNVNFAYEQRAVLKNVSFFIPENTTTAIVGPSGSGKTTICNLLARFYDADQGSIAVGGIDIKTMTCDSLLKNIAMVFQHVYLFRDTLRNNIRFGKPEASDAEIIAAAQKACCHDFIMALPDQYDTVIGDGGCTLSGGEKQRISIARAMLKNAPIILLDEATASVDPENEHAIQQAISSLVQGKTMIVIAHRLATIQNADQILVVDDGCITQQGTHEELLRQEGVYKRFLALRQAAEGWSI